MRHAATLFFLFAALVQAQEQRPAVRTSTAGVLIDVTVLDKDGRPVTDLKTADFEIAEDGKPQQILSATLMRGGVPARLSPGAETGTAAPAAAAGAGSPAPPATAPDRPPTPTVTAILFDSLSSDTRPFATRAAAQFVSTLATGNEYGGVFLSGLGLATIQPFTNRTADLRAAIEAVATTASNNLSVEAQRKRSMTRTQGLDAASPVTASAEEGRGWTTIAEYEQRLYGISSDPSEKLLTQLELRMEDSYSRFLKEYEGEASLSGLRSAIAGLALMPGRKSILYFTDELPITSRLKPKFDALIAEANRVNITIYPVDAAGLRVQSADAQAARGVNVAGAQGIGDVSRGDGAYTKDLEKQSDGLSSRLTAVLGRLANETGGFMIENTNDLGRGVARMQIERNTYYLLGYQPTNTATDGKFRKVSVKIKRGKYTVRARPGYALPK